MREREREDKLSNLPQWGNYWFWSDLVQTSSNSPLFQLKSCIFRTFQSPHTFLSAFFVSHWPLRWWLENAQQCWPWDLTAEKSTMATHSLTHSSFFLLSIESGQTMAVKSKVCPFSVFFLLISLLHFRRGGEPIPVFFEKCWRQWHQQKFLNMWSKLVTFLNKEKST